MDCAIQELLESYHELNGSLITEMQGQPSALEFMRYVAKNRPFVIRQGCAEWPAVKKWNAAYLRHVMRENLVKVAITPNGNADAVVTNVLEQSGLFVKPLEVYEPFNNFLDYVQQQERDGDIISEVKYAQTQNNNLREEYFDLFLDVEKDIPWARIALEREPEAINLWIGNSRSITALHRDNYENIYCQVVGRKHFVLLSPMETACIDEADLQSATYMRERSKGHEGTNLSQENERELVIKLDDGRETVPCATWDPDKPDMNFTAFSAISKPMRCSLQPGDMLYLPALWYHKVSQTCGGDGICCAVNYWYDMDFDGHLYSASAFIRNIALIATNPRTKDMHV